MRVICGPPGSGKSAVILGEAREFIRCGDGDFRIVVPTATMAEHLLHSLAREGLLVRPSSVGTLSALVSELAPGDEDVSGGELALLVQQCLGAAPPEEFAALTETPGLAAAIASAIEDLANSGCDPLQWEALGRMGLWRGGLHAAFGRVWELAAAALRSRGLCLRAQRIALAAAAVRAGAAPALPRTIFIDGFFLFSRVEIEFLKALAQRTQLWLTLPEWPGAKPVLDALSLGPSAMTRLTACRRQPSVELFHAVHPERECEEIALRLLQARRGGLAWCEMGVIVRAAGPYAPVLERVFARLGIPSRFYFGTPLAATAPYRFLRDWVLAAVSGWELRQTLAALRSSAREGEAETAAALLERLVIDALPGEGLGRMASIATALAHPGAERLARTLAEWEPHASWAAGQAPPAEWARRLAALPLAPPPDPALAPDPAAVRIARIDAAAIQLISSALQACARLMDEAPLTLEAFWAQAGPSLASAPVRPPDGRRDAVHVMDVYEARQWELAAVFVCGLNEGQFPGSPRTSALLGDGLRLRLRQQGFPLLLDADREMEEDFLFRVATTRATRSLTLSCSLHDAGGAPLLPSFILDELGLSPASARPLLIQPARPVAPARRANLQAPEILDAIRAAHRPFRPTWIEDYLQCPFRFFARWTLRLRENPAPPDQRLTPALIGGVMHQAIHQWHAQGGRLAAILARCWRKALAEHRVPPTWRNEINWLLLERSARFYEAKGGAEPGWSVSTELELTVQSGDFQFKGRADRVDRHQDGRARVLEFKFVGATGLKKRRDRLESGLLIQAPLYALALEQSRFTPVGYSIVALRGDTQAVSIDHPDEVRAGMDRAAALAANAAFQITQGDIRVMPADEELCRHCPFQDACRKRQESATPEIAARGGDLP